MPAGLARGEVTGRLGRTPEESKAPFVRPRGHFAQPLCAFRFLSLTRNKRLTHAMLPYSPCPPRTHLQLNLTGAGLTETLKATWRDPKPEEESEK